MKLIDRTKEHIKKLYPFSKDVNVHFEREADGSFVSKIHVVTKDHVFHATKRDASLRKSLDKSYHAIRTQLGKLKGKWAH